ncbi:hypothetical protein [Chromohalobacter nigrandesensis]|uniref:hypothetical protein n=1 Tax=Chromohalobacter nigrandesensis TaxID=119863 RepID=UPI001FF6CDBE|nr:hypothetical protein [Chromohalobacter nigrandesensis]MCK0746757.1 hypothetical protein [Chromohalobacter nigrandesensis]
MHEKVFRTIVIAKKESGFWVFVYGHSIEWLLSPLDYNVNPWIKRNLKGRYYVFIADIDDYGIIEEWVRNNAIRISTDTKTVVIPLNNEQSERVFLDKLQERLISEYSPFIGHCSQSIVFFPEATDVGFAESILEDEIVVDLLKKEYSIDFKKSPEIVGTYWVHSPTRLDFESKFFDNKVSASVEVHDYFKLYQGADVEVTFFQDSQEYSFGFYLDSETHLVDMGFEPDFIKVKVAQDGVVIYDYSSSFVKKVSFTLRSLSGPSVVGEDGEVHSRFVSSEFGVGKE